MRIDPKRFVWSESFRRVLRKCEGIRIEVSRPSVTPQRLELYERYHAERSANRGWDVEGSNAQEYYYAFVENARNYGYEFAYYYRDRLVGIALIDALPMGLSAVYCYYEPEMRSFSLGTYSILWQLLFAKAGGFDRLYLGYWVRENASLAYKARFKPYELLRGRPELDQSAEWA
jgi:arginine-tRNA-protein transferase